MEKIIISGIMICGLFLFQNNVIMGVDLGR
jgi:hypothetical protein